MIFGLDVPMMQTALIYAIIFAAPFVQEDAAVFGAATAAATGQGDPVWVFAAILSGLTVSDVWKYGIGRLSHRVPRMARWATDPRIQRVRGEVLNNLAKALLVARFVPGTRIPLYIACGVFKAPFFSFLALLVTGGAIYVGLAFFLVRQLGSVASGYLHTTIPIVVVAIIVVVVGVGWLRQRRVKAQAASSGTSDRDPV